MDQESFGVHRTRDAASVLTRHAAVPVARAVQVRGECIVSVQIIPLDGYYRDTGYQ